MSKPFRLPESRANGRAGGKREWPGERQIQRVASLDFIYLLAGDLLRHRVGRLIESLHQAEHSLQERHEAKWIDENPACKLESPRVTQRPTMPFTPDQMADTLSTSEKYGSKCRGGKYRGAENARCIRALALLLRHSGPRIGDALTLERSRITADKLFLYTAKTGIPVYVLLPEFVLTALVAVPKIRGRYFFWAGGSKVDSATGLAEDA